MTAKSSKVTCTATQEDIREHGTPLMIGTEFLDMKWSEVYRKLCEIDERGRPSGAGLVGRLSMAIISKQIGRSFLLLIGGGWRGKSTVFLRRWGSYRTICAV